MRPSPGMAITKREFLSGLRSVKPYLFLAFVMLVMIAGLVFMLAVVLQDAIRYGGAIGSREVRALFMVFSLGLYFSAILLVPPMAGVSICTEKQQDSYDLLRMTYIRPFSLAMAKLLNVLGIYALIGIATLPIVGVFFFLVGIDWTQFVQSIAIIIASALSCAVIGLLCSAWFYRTLPAIITTYVIGFLFHGGFLLLMGISLELFFPYFWLDRFMSSVDEQFILSLCPMVALVLIGEGDYSFPATLFALFFHGTIVVAGLWLTLVILNRPTRPMRVETERPIDDQAQLAARRKQFPYYLLDPRRRRALISDGRNPVFSKEMQTGLLGRGTFAVRVFYSATLFCLIVSMFCIVSNGFQISNYGPFTALPVYVDTIFILFITPTLVATALAREHEWGNLDMLRMTLLEPRQIIAGKFQTAAITALLPIGSALLGCAPVVFFSYQSPYAWAGLASGFGTMLVCVLYTLCISLLVSVTCRRSLSALMLGYGASIFALALVPAMALFALLLLYRGHDVGDELVQAVAFLSPVVAQAINLGEVREGHMTTRYWLLNITAFTLVSAVLLKCAALRFTRYLDRGAG